MATKAHDQGVASTRKSRIPTFDSIEEEAEFWDTHDTTEFEDESEDVTDVRFVPRRLPNSIVVQLDETTYATLRDRAFARGVGLSTLAREWILERLGEPADQR